MIKLELNTILIILIVLLGVVIVCKYIDNRCPCTQTQLKNGNSQTKESFEESIQQENKNAKLNELKDEIVLYYTEWCGYSRAFKPEWDAFAKEAKSKFPNLRVDEIRCEGGHERTCSEKGIEGYPTIHFYKKDGTQVLYTGDRTASGLSKFVEKSMS